MKQIRTNEPLPHVDQVRERLHELASHLQQDASSLNDPQAAALFETSAEVIAGLQRAFDHFHSQREHAWRKLNKHDEP